MKKRSLILGIAMLMTFSLAFTGCSKGASKSAFKDGTYSGKAEGVHGDIELGVEIKGGKIAKINVVNQGETSGVSEVAFEQVPAEIIKKQSAEVDSVAGATVSSEAIKNAVKDALNKAKK